MFWAIAAAVVSAVSTFSQMEAARAQSEYEADVARNNAIAKRQQAEITRKQTEAQMRAKDEEAERVRRNYTQAAGTNRSLLSSGNVDITQGSALDLLEGNYNMYADDMGELEFEKAQTAWAGRREADIQEWEGDVYDDQASFLEDSAGSVFGSLLGGVGAGVGTYAMLSAGSSAFDSTPSVTSGVPQVYAGSPYISKTNPLGLTPGQGL